MRRSSKALARRRRRFPSAPRRPGSRRCSSPCAKAARDVVRVLLKAGADVNEPVPVEGGPRRRCGDKRSRRGATPLLTGGENGHFELAARCSRPAPIRTPTLRASRRSTLTWVRKPGDGDDDPAPEGSGNMSSLQLVEKLVAHGADVNARMRSGANLGKTRLNEVGATPFLLAALTADVQLMRDACEARRRPVHAERRELHAADGRGRPGDTVARRGGRDRARGARGGAAGARARRTT